MGLLQNSSDVQVFPLAKIINADRVDWGNNIIIDDFCFLYFGPNSKIGDFVHIAGGVIITGGGEIKIEDFAAISATTKIFTGNDDYSGKCLTNPTVPNKFRKVIRSRVVIEKHALIGAGAIILPGVTIGAGARVGAGSLVKQDIPPWQIWAGSPAKFIKEYDPTEILRQEAELRSVVYAKDGAYLPKLAWWEKLS